jgi:hypothetical protein
MLWSCNHALSERLLLLGNRYFIELKSAKVELSRCHLTGKMRNDADVI